MFDLARLGLLVKRALTNPDASNRPSNKNTQSRGAGVNLDFFLLI